MAIEFEPEIDENTRDASAGVITDASAQRGIVAASRQIEAGEDRGVSVAALGSTKVAAEQQRKKAEKAAEDTRFIMLLDQARGYSVWLGKEIGKIDDQFEAKYGDAWRETLANKFLDPDEIPERREGESMKDYRERVEDAIEDKLIDPATGKLRPEYRGNEDAELFEKRVELKREKQSADRRIEQAERVANDPNATEAERQAAYEGLEEISNNERQQVEKGMQAKGLDTSPVDEITDEQRSEIAQARPADAEAAAFGLG
ncbi:hypothetical protein [Citromicrobium bathyomarinum]|uniref:hypothetical protein n=1 Tax=Citromicrobium bathyomarinum TaxID=72174 RepID=UPI001E3A5619|nr:hypothetical protein [Citromicrobium bathyomarinum]MCD1624330.1 hypothetical protein [Citromicrobium bathyomarinum]